MDEILDRVVRDCGPEVRGCSAEEIEEIRVRQGVMSIPDEYLCYLRRIGRSAGRFQVGTDTYYPEILELKDAARDLLVENNSQLVLGPNSLVFEMHQGYEFAWFPDVENHQPVVNHYNEGRSDEIREWPSLSAYLRWRV
jgi:hypothetical protein